MKAPIQSDAVRVVRHDFEYTQRVKREARRCRACGATDEEVAASPGAGCDECNP